MAARSGDRSEHFPAIEKKYGQPMSYWFGQMASVKDAKYPEQIAFLRENHGFSQAHANALVMYTRGSTSSKRVRTFTDYLATCNPQQRKTIKTIFSTLQAAYPKLELVIAWNQPMLRNPERYVFGCSAASHHILIAPFEASVLQDMAKDLADYEVLKKTVRVPNNWDVDAKLLKKMVKLVLSR